MNYDLIVVGTGGVGSAALYHAAKRGLRVLGIDQFTVAHNRGSSHGESRMIRKSYFEHPSYVPLLQRAYRLWDEVADACGQSLFFRNGVVYFGPPESAIIQGVMYSAETYDLRLEEFDPKAGRFARTLFSPPEHFVGLFEEDAGYLLVEECVRAYLDLATEAGAELHTKSEVLSWEQSGDSLVVTTRGGSFSTDSLVFTAGAWSASILSDLEMPLRVLRKHLHWFSPLSDEYRSDKKCPGFFFQSDGGVFYGFPSHSELGVKVANHAGGTAVSNPGIKDDAPEEEDSRAVDVFVRNRLPGISGNRSAHATCYYTMTPDEHFIVDRHPLVPNVAFAAGLSGHGFKFASVLGEILVDLATGNDAELDLSFLSLSRETLRDEQLQR